MSTVGDLFTRVWSCHARVFTNFKCSAEEPNRDPRHEGCGYRYQASFTEDDFAGIKDMQLVKPTTQTCPNCCGPWGDPHTCPTPAEVKP